MRIREHFVEISKDRIQSFINRNREHCSKYPIFSNKEDLKPVIAKQPMEWCQIDLVVFKKAPSKDENGNIYINIFLVALTFFHGISFFEDWNQKTQLKELIN